MEPAYFVIERMALRAITCFQRSGFVLQLCFIAGAAFSAGGGRSSRLKASPTLRC